MFHIIHELWTSNKKLLIIGGAETILIIGLFAYIIIREPTPTIKTQDIEKPLQDSIKLLMKQYDVVQQDKMRLGHLNDSLVDLKTNIQIVTKTKIQYEKSAPIDTATNFVHRALATLPD